MQIFSDPICLCNKSSFRFCAEQTEFHGKMPREANKFLRHKFLCCIISSSMGIVMNNWNADREQWLYQAIEQNELNKKKR